MVCDMDNDNEVRTLPTIPVQAVPFFVDYSNCINHGELSFREQCPLLQTLPLEFVVSSSFEQPSMTRTINTLPSKMMQQAGGHQVVQPSLAQSFFGTSSSCLASDELNTPEINMDDGMQFNFDSAMDTPPAAMEDNPLFDWRNSIAFNSPREQPIREVLGFDETPTVRNRPTELTLSVHLDSHDGQLSSFEPHGNIKNEMPTFSDVFTLNTPDIMKQLVDGDLIKFVDDDTNNLKLDSPQIVFDRGTPSMIPAPIVKQEIPSHSETLGDIMTVSSTTIEEDCKPNITDIIPLELLSPSHTRKRTRSSVSSKQTEYENSEPGPSRRRRIVESIKDSEDEDDGMTSIAGSAAESTYHDLRIRNNMASRRSRQNRKHRELEREQEANQLEAEHKRLQSVADKLQHQISYMRQLLMDTVKTNKK